MRSLTALLSEAGVALARGLEDAALIAQQRLRIAKLERQVYGQRSERSALRLALASLGAGAAG